MIKHHFQLTEISFGQCLYPWQHYHNDQNTIWEDCNNGDTFMICYSRI